MPLKPVLSVQIQYHPPVRSLSWHTERTRRVSESRRVVCVAQFDSVLFLSAEKPPAKESAARNRDYSAKKERVCIQSKQVDNLSAAHKESNGERVKSPTDFKLYQHVGSVSNIHGRIILSPKRFFLSVFPLLLFLTGKADSHGSE